MNDKQLEKMTVAELRDLAARAQVQITVKQNQMRIDMRNRWAQEAKDAGVDINELIVPVRGYGRFNGNERKHRAAVYQHPLDHTKTWGGRGRKPQWLKEAGDNVEAYRIPSIR